MFVPAVSRRVPCDQISDTSDPKLERVRVVTVQTASNAPDANFAAVSAPLAILASVIAFDAMADAVIASFAIEVTAPSMGGEIARPVPCGVISMPWPLPPADAIVAAFPTPVLIASAGPSLA